MIIPPDPEKDPNLFAQSTASLLLEGDLVDLDSPLVDVPSLPSIAYHPASAPNVLGSYSYGNGPFADDFAVYETLPPYEGRRSLSRTTSATPGATLAAPGAGVGHSAEARRSAGHGSGPVLIRSASRASTASGSSTSSQRLPWSPLSGSSRRSMASSTVAASSPTEVGSRSKLWEGLVIPEEKTKKWHGLPLPRLPTVPVSPEMRSMWQKHRKLYITLLVLAAAVIVLAIGLAVGFTTAMAAQTRRAKWPPYHDREGKGRTPSNAWQVPDLNITYKAGRDGPYREDGVPSNCDIWTPIDKSAAFSQLSVSSESFQYYMATYNFPLKAEHNGMKALANPWFFLANGLASSGTVEFIGSDAPATIISGGAEDVIEVDVIARYMLDTNVTTVCKVCQLTREDGSTGLGIYTPVRTDGGPQGPFLRDPLRTPAFHVIIRMPPSTMESTAAPVYIPKLTVDLNQMGARIGDLKNIVEFGEVEIAADCKGGGVVVNYLAADSLAIYGSESSVQGTFNVSSSLNINSTSGAILANVILNDPSLPNDTSVTTSSVLPGPVPRDMSRFDDALNSRDLKYVEPSKDMTGMPHLPPNVAQLDTDVLVPTHSINTTFKTNEGFMYVAYLHHPPSTALQSFVTSQSGMVSVAMHPNYVGPFALQNVWGSIRLPGSEFDSDHDPLQQGRTRMVVQGDIDMSGEWFESFGANETTASLCSSAVSGTAIWAYPKNRRISASAQQKSNEAQGSAFIAETKLGDIQVSF